MDEVATEVSFAIALPLGVGPRELTNAQAIADAMEHVIELVLLVSR
jgi:hypothetical protein